MKKKWNLLLAIVLCSTFASAQEEQEKQTLSFSLDEAISYSLEHSYATQTSKAEVKSAEQIVKETYAIGLPQINATAEYQNMIDLPVSLIPGEIFNQPGKTIEASFGVQHNASFGITVSQLIFSGEYIIGTQASQIYKDISIKQNTKTEKDVKEAVEKSYHLALVSEKSSNIIDSTLLNMQQLHDETSKIFEQGLIDDVTMDQLTLTMKNIEKMKASLGRMVEVSQRLLKLQMGIDFNTEIELTNSLEDFINLSSLDKMCMEEFDVNNNINYNITELNVTVQQNLLKYQRSTYLPTLGAFFSYSRNGMNNDFGELFKPKWYPTTVAGLSLNVPIFNSGSKQAQVNQAKIDVSKAEILKEQTRQGLHTQVLQKKGDLSTAIETFKLEEDNMKLAKKIYDKTLIKFKQGMASNTDLTQTQNQYLDTQAKYFSAMIEMLNKKAELENLLYK